MKQLVCVVCSAMLLSISGCAKKESDALFKSRYSNEFMDRCIKQFSVTEFDLPYSSVKNYCDCSLNKLFEQNSLEEVREIEASSLAKKSASELKKITLDDLINNPNVKKFGKSFKACDDELGFSKQKREAREAHEAEEAERKERGRKIIEEGFAMQRKRSEEARERQAQRDREAVRRHYERQAKLQEEMSAEMSSNEADTMVAEPVELEEGVDMAEAY